MLLFHVELWQVKKTQNNVQSGSYKASRETWLYICCSYIVTQIHRFPIHKQSSETQNQNLKVPLGLELQRV